MEEKEIGFTTLCADGHRSYFVRKVTEIRRGLQAHYLPLDCDTCHVTMMIGEKELRDLIDAAETLPDARKELVIRATATKRP